MVGGVVSFESLLDAGHVRRSTTLTDADVTQRVALRDAIHAVYNEITHRVKRLVLDPTRHIDRIWTLELGDYDYNRSTRFVFVSICCTIRYNMNYM